MNLEIERKFLLKSIPNIDPYEKIDIEQIYMKIGNVWERVRYCQYKNKNQNKWIHTIKTSVSKGVNMEDEKEISESDFLEFKNKSKIDKYSRSIFKTRHVFKTNDNLYWEIDEFHNDYRLVIAEIEIPSMEYKIETPDYISELILMEVTGLKQFSNKSLSIKNNKI